MSSVFKIVATLITIILFTILCVILYKTIKERRQERQHYNKNNSMMPYVTNCPDYWTPYYNKEQNKYVCVSDNPDYNAKMKSILQKAPPSRVRKLEFDKVKHILSDKIANNISMSSVTSQNKFLYYIPSAENDFSKNSAKCIWANETCLPWSGVNTVSGGNKCSNQMTKCSNYNIDQTSTKPTPFADPKNTPIYFYNYALGNNDAVNTTYIPNLYGTNLLIDKSVDDQKKTGQLNSSK